MHDSDAMKEVVKWILSFVISMSQESDKVTEYFKWNILCAHERALLENLPNKSDSLIWFLELHYVEIIIVNFLIDVCQIYEIFGFRNMLLEFL